MQGFVTGLVCTKIREEWSCIYSDWYAEFEDITDLNVSMTGYACGTENLEIDGALEAISRNNGF